MARRRGKNTGAKPKVRDSQASGPSTTNESQSKQNKKLEKNTTTEQKRNLETSEEIKDAPNNNKKNITAVEAIKIYGKLADLFSRLAYEKKDQSGKPEKEVFENDSHLHNHLAACSEFYEVMKGIFFPEKSEEEETESNELKESPLLCQDSKLVDTDKSSKLPAEVLNTKSQVRAHLNGLEDISSIPGHLKNKASSDYASYLGAEFRDLSFSSNLVELPEEDTIDDKKSSLDAIASEENKMGLFVKDYEVDDSLCWTEYVNVPENTKTIFDYNTLKPPQGLFSKDEKETILIKSEVSGPIPVEHDFEDIDERKMISERETMQLIEFSPEIKKKASKSSSKESVPLLQDSILVDINNEIQSLHLNTSKTQIDVSPENKEKFIQPKMEEFEETVNLEKNVNLRFEFNNMNNKKVLVDGKDYNIIDHKNQKTTFNVNNGNVKLSFIDNKVFIFTEGGEINCSMLRNRMFFSISDNTTQSVPTPEKPYDYIMSDKDDAVSKELDSAVSKELDSAVSKE